MDILETGIQFNESELNVIRQWFDSFQDSHSSDHLSKEEYLIAESIYKKLGWRVPHSILIGCGKMKKK